MQQAEESVAFSDSDESMTMKSLLLDTDYNYQEKVT